MDFNLYGDAAQAAKRCCSEMATGHAARPSAKRPALCGRPSSGRVHQTPDAAFELRPTAARFDSGGFFTFRRRALTRRAVALRLPVLPSMARSVRYRP
jgi:hypothetical protein